MEEKFLAAWQRCRAEAQALGVKIRPGAAVLADARRCLNGSRESEGFVALEALGRLDLSLEALAVDRRFTALFTDEEANEALRRLLEAGYSF